MTKALSITFGMAHRHEQGNQSYSKRSRRDLLARYLQNGTPVTLTLLLRRCFFGLLKLQAGEKARKNILIHKLKTSIFPVYRQDVLARGSSSTGPSLQRLGTYIVCTRPRNEFQDERRGWRSPPSVSKPLLTNHMIICSVAKNRSCRAVPGSALCAGPI